MNAQRGRRKIAWSLVVSVGLAACGPSVAPNPVVVTQRDQHEPPGSALTNASITSSAADAPLIAPEAGVVVPVTIADPSWGNPLAPVTMVIWGDYECPFTARLVNQTLPMLQEQYGANQLRVIWKHFPLPFHKNARSAHIAAETVFQFGGASAFWRFHERAFQNQKSLHMDSFVDWAKESGVDRVSFKHEFIEERFASKVDDDITFGKNVGVSGTPASFINGIFVSGAQPIESFRKVIDGQLVEAAALVRTGISPERVYAELSDKNYQKPPPPAPPRPPPDTTTAWKVPIDGSPVRGSKTARVTVIMFGDFQCPFCKRVAPTIADLERKYGHNLRFVFKHNPLPMHSRAEPVAQFVIEAGVQKGETAFWKAYQAIYDDPTKVEDADLEDLARALGLDPKRMKKAIDGHAHRARIERDQSLAADLQAAGTPHFFINGRRLVGAQPIENFQAIIDEEIMKTWPIETAGMPADKLYDFIQKDAKTVPVNRIPAPTAPPVPAPSMSTGAPSVGQFGAKHLVVMYVGSRRAPTQVTRSRTEALARVDEARKKLAAGANFEDIVALYSDEPGAAQRGGDLGLFPRGAMVPEFQTALESITVGVISGIVETPFGFHIILRTK